LLKANALAYSKNWKADPVGALHISERHRLEEPGAVGESCRGVEGKTKPRM